MESYTRKNILLVYNQDRIHMGVSLQDIHNEMLPNSFLIRKK